MLGLCLVTQIITGIFLAIFFTAEASIAFDSVIFISRDVNYGWLIRRVHANGASMFFVCIYIHIGRGLYYRSYLHKHTWLIGVTIFLLTILTAFLGYVLPWGQISYWAATVITNLVSTLPYLGASIVAWLWGGFRVTGVTLVRFYAFHFAFPFLIAALSIAHLFFLHRSGSSNPLGSSSSSWVKFHPYFTSKDLLGVLLFWSIFGYLVFFNPFLLSDPENFIPANQLVTPTHIMPEWYFLPIYAILRSIPSKLGGVVALIISILVLYLWPYSDGQKIRNFLFWLLVATFILLGWIGRLPVEAPYEFIGRAATIFYFFLATPTWSR